jgi:hypothetical protein
MMNCPQEWTDEYLVWDPLDYGNLTSIVLSPRKIWTPKMAIGNTYVIHI